MTEKIDSDHGQCEGCSKQLRTGDKAHICNDGPILCEECAPTFGELQQAANWELEGKVHSFSFTGRQQAVAAIEKVAAHIKGGGSMDDPVVVEL